MKRKIIQIDTEKCNGCGACAAACHEGAIAMVDGKARLMRDDYCDGLGDCLPACPTGAITFTEREAAAYDQEAVLRSKAQGNATTHSGCPGSAAHTINHSCPGSAPAALRPAAENAVEVSSGSVSELTTWPVQIQLAPVNAPYFDHARLLVAADCTAYARADFHARFVKGHVTLIGCPKLDDADYADKLTEILINNNIKSVTVVRMQVPCCGGIEYAVKTALQRSGKMIPWQVVTLSTDGEILD
ncbi:MAG: 4Fe-4S binding protein [Butyrivibrio sp.]|nr:4Fe-4S binding protein [Butyrivibrio sp.]